MRSVFFAVCMLLGGMGAFALGAAGSDLPPRALVFTSLMTSTLTIPTVAVLGQIVGSLQKIIRRVP